MVAELFLSAFLQVMFERSTPHVKDLWNLARREGLEKKLESLLELFRENEAVLADAEEKQLTQSIVKLWLNKLKDLVYDAEDVLDEFSTESLRQQLANQQALATSKCFKLVPDLKFRIKMGSKIDAIISKLKDNSKQIDKLSLMVCGGGGGATEPTSLRPTLPTTPEPIEQDVYGREKDKKNIIHLLQTDDQNCHVIPIVAMGGAGKTTLAQHVYKDVAHDFELKAWVCVSVEFDVMRIMKAILMDLTDQPCEFNELQPIQKKLNETLKGKRFLIVLDDIWDNITFTYEKWLFIDTLFTIGAPGSKMIVTTRQKEVAEKMRITEPYMLKLLSDDDCWLLFKTHAFKKRGVDEPPNLELIHEKIVQRCDGLPLAARTLGGILCSNTSNDWKEILDNKIWSVPTVQGDVPNVLRLSYYYLPPHLKKCFAYCAIFPQDYKFTEKELVLLWIVEGLIHQNEEREQLIQKGHTYFRGLLSRSLFQASNDDGSKYTMHDLVHDLAKDVGGELYFLLNDVSESHKEIGRARHFSYITRRYDISKRFEIFLKTKHLRTFLPIQMMEEEDQYVSRSVLNLTFQLKKLRVLSFHGYQITELSDSIGNLKHLRYLDLSSTQIRCLPETTCSLHNLLILSLRDCQNLRALPSKIQNLINLFYLDITNARSLQEMPIGIKELKSLQILSNFIVGKSNRCGLNELMNFNDLSGKLHISSLDNVVDTTEAKKASLDEKNNLKVLVLEWSSDFNDSQDFETEKSVLELLQPNQNIEELTIINYGGNAFSTWLGVPLFSSMNMLKLENCELCTCLPPLGQLPSLKTLQISRMHGVKRVGAEFYGSPHSKVFPSLKSLSFKGMSEWENWSDFEQAEGFSVLSILCIISCPKLSGNPPNHLPSLKKLVVRHCEKFNVEISNFPKLYELTIDGCLNLISRSMPTTIESLAMKCCPVPGRSPTTLCSLTSLTMLHIENCLSSESLPSALFFLPVLEIVVLDHLPNLRIAIDGVNDDVTSEGLLTTANMKLKIENCPSLVCISTRGILLSSLTDLEIRRCPRLEFVIETFLEKSKLESIKIINCENLQRLGKGMRSLDLLKHIEISDCPNFLYFSQGGLASNKLKALEITECQNQEGLLDGIDNMTSLTRFNISYCKLIKFVAEEDLFTNLKELRIFGKCPEMEGIVIKLPISLTLLRISDCKEMTSIPNIPISLTKLYIDSCRKLTTLSNNLSMSSLIKLNISLCEEMTSIPNIPISLTELHIDHCRKLTTLPNNLSTSSLIKLDISYCEEMTFLPNLPLSLTKLNFARCPKLISLPNLPNNLIQLYIRLCKEMTSMPNIPNSLVRLYTYDCPKLTTLPNNLPASSLIQLTIQLCEGMTSIPNIPNSLTRLNINDCEKLTTLPNNLSTSSLVEMRISDYERMRYLPDLPISLVLLNISNCKNLESINSSSSSNSFRNLTSLQYLTIWGCPKLKSLPKEGLPPSLLRLEIDEYPKVSKRCKRDKGKDWLKIADIPFVWIDGELI